jgi:hypothetical protein
VSLDLSNMPRVEAHTLVGVLAMKHRSGQYGKPKRIRFAEPRAYPVPSRSPKRARQDSQFCHPPEERSQSRIARPKRSPSSSARRRIPISLRPKISTSSSPPDHFQYRQDGARTCTYLALLRRSDALNGPLGARKKKKIRAAGLRAVY